jgi:hypothetical protein
MSSFLPENTPVGYTEGVEIDPIVMTQRGGSRGLSRGLELVIAGSPGKVCGCQRMVRSFTYVVPEGPTVRCVR